jgi:MFS family permease
VLLDKGWVHNAIFFTYALVLVVFYGVPDQKVGLDLLPFALGNFVGPLTLGRLFDSIGRKPMIATTYFISGTLLFITGWLFKTGYLTAQTQAHAWTIIFFVASSAASAAYLTVR